MNEEQALSVMYPPGVKRPGKRAPGGVMQIWITRACDKSCFNCTQGSNLRGTPGMITVEQFEQACLSLDGYFGTVGVFGGNPAVHPKFEEICEVMCKHIPRKRRGLWCNNPMGKGKAMAKTFNPMVSNLNTHLDQEAHKEFKRDWPKSLPFGNTKDSRHSPVFVAMKDVIEDEGKRWELISGCDINKYWSAMIAPFRGELRGWFCEIAAAQSILHQHEPDYPDTGIPLVREDATIDSSWWKLSMKEFAPQVRKHCHDCGIPLRGYGELAQSTDSASVEQVSETHKSIYSLKKQGRKLELVTKLEQLGDKSLGKVTDYMGNAGK